MGEIRPIRGQRSGRDKQMSGEWQLSEEKKRANRISLAQCSSSKSGYSRSIRHKLRHDTTSGFPWGAQKTRHGQRNNHLPFAYPCSFWRFYSWPTYSRRALRQTKNRVAIPLLHVIRWDSKLDSIKINGTYNVKKPSKSSYSQALDNLFQASGANRNTPRRNATSGLRWEARQSQQGEKSRRDTKFRFPQTRHSESQ